ncbi:MAG TPA: molybdate ABC transporter substrate-binding protein [Bryobacteraceae bacterium]|nr:molybdate ABC transporter substrate-binding protein [Bryobacteraceae bacterium]
MFPSSAKPQSGRPLLSTFSLWNVSLLLSSCLLIFCRPAPAQAILTVAAAADLADLQKPLAHSQPIRFVIASSAVLRQQIENGAPYDVFLSANAAYVDQLASSGKLEPGSVRVYAVGQVGLLWRDGKHHPVSDLTANWVRIVALPNPRLAPYGVAAQQALEHASLWAKVQPKVVYGENVRETLELFTSGNADAVLTSASLLVGKNPDLIPADWHAPIVQKGGIVASTHYLDAARRFMDFLTSPAGQAIFARFGFESQSGH